MACILVVEDDAEIRDGIGWLIVYRTGRSWHALTVWSDLGNNEWETDDINDALEALRLDPRAVALNGYYLGHFGDMTIDDIAAGIRWHYERGTNALADDDTLMQARADIEAARQQAAEAGLPFSERLVDGPEDELDPYTYDGSMTPEDYEAMQQARDTHAALVEVVTDRYPNATEEAIERIGTGRYCLDKMGFTNVTYYAYEIDKPAMTVALSNYPDIIQLGDAFDLRRDDWELGKRFENTTEQKAEMLESPKQTTDLSDAPEEIKKQIVENDRVLKEMDDVMPVSLPEGFDVVDQLTELLAERKKLHVIDEENLRYNCDIIALEYAIGTLRR